MLKKKTNLKLLAGVIISIVFLYFSVKGIHLDRLLPLLKNANWRYIPPLIIVTLLGFLLRSLRWQFLLKSTKYVSIYKLWSLEFIGYGLSNVYPARLGEFIRAYLLGKQEGISGSSALASIVVERILDGLTVLFLFTLILNFFSLPGKTEIVDMKLIGTVTLPQLGFLALCFYLTIIGFLVWSYFSQKKALGVIRTVLLPFPLKFSSKLVEKIQNFISGLHLIKHPGNLVIAFLFSLVLWFFIVISAYLTFLLVSVEFANSLPFYATGLVVVLLALVLMVPAAPGNIGTMQYGCIISLGLLGVEKTQAFGFSILFHGLQYIVVTILGFFYLWKHGISLKRIVKKQEEGDGSA